MPQRNNRAFTLIELLIVVAIIMILVSILLPALSNVRLLAKGTVCGGKMGSIAKAMQSFAFDHQQVLPGGVAPLNQGPEAWQKSFVGKEVAMLVGGNFANEPGTLLPYLQNSMSKKAIKSTYRCPLLEEGGLGSGVGSNGVFDYAVPNIFFGARVDMISTGCQNRPGWGQWRQMSTPLVIEESPRYCANSRTSRREPAHGNIDRLGTWHGGFEGGGSINIAGVDGSVQKIGFGSSSKAIQNIDDDANNDVLCGSVAKDDWIIPTPSRGTCAIPICNYGAYNRW
jgi:prepilin-type N-terminal cleavage/methylation domain-containing protein